MRNNFSGKGFAKPRLIFLAGILDFVRAEEGSEEESVRVSVWIFWQGGLVVNNQMICYNETVLNNLLKQNHA